MTTNRPYNVPVANLQQVLDMAKYIYEDVIMQTISAANNKAECKILMVQNDQFESIPSVSLMLKSTKTDYYIYHSFALVFDHKGNKNIVFQIETYPDWEVSHIEKGVVCHGSHVHELGKVYEIREENPSWDWYNWMDEFAKRVNLFLCGERVPPFQGELF